MLEIALLILAVSASVICLTLFLLVILTFPWRR